MKELDNEKLSEIKNELNLSIYGILSKYSDIISKINVSVNLTLNDEVPAYEITLVVEEDK